MELAAIEHLKSPYNFYMGSQVSDRCLLGYLFLVKPDMQSYTTENLPKIRKVR